jgi:hypothetical protein
MDLLCVEKNSGCSMNEGVSSAEPDDRKWKAGMEEREAERASHSSMPAFGLDFET